MISSAVEGKNTRNFKNGHKYNINAISMSPDGENFISADDLTVNLWNLENNICAYNLIDVKPTDEGGCLNEVITSVEFHPRRPETFVYSSSRGYMSLCDLRQSTNAQKCSQRF